MLQDKGNNSPGYTNPLKDSSAHSITAGDLEAVFLPGYGMIVASMRHRGEEILGLVEDLETMAGNGSAAGVPLLHPWANRLADNRYRVADREVALDLSSPLLHLDGNGLPIHGVPWSRLSWEIVESSKDGLSARLDWESDELLAIFPFRHRLEMAATLRPDGLLLETKLFAGPDSPVPVSFGFHPYFRLPGLPRTQWRLALPAMRRLLLDRNWIPTAGEEPFDGIDAQLEDLDFDDGFVLPDEKPSFSIAGAGRRISVEFLEGFRYGQVYAPRGREYVALEPMTAPTNALKTGDGLQIVNPGGSFRAVFKIRIETLP